MGTDLPPKWMDHFTLPPMMDDYSVCFLFLPTFGVNFLAILMCTWCVPDGTSLWFHFALPDRQWACFHMLTGRCMWSVYMAIYLCEVSNFCLFFFSPVRFVYVVVWVILGLAITSYRKLELFHQPNSFHLWVGVLFCFFF